MNLVDYANQFNDSANFKLTIPETAPIVFTNSKGKEFSIPVEQIYLFLRIYFQSIDEKLLLLNDLNYDENTMRNFYKSFSSEGVESIVSMGGSQTKGLTTIIEKVICFCTGQEYQNCKPLHFGKQSLKLFFSIIPEFDAKQLIHNTNIDNSHVILHRYKKYIETQDLSESSKYKYTNSFNVICSKEGLTYNDLLKLDVNSLKQLKETISNRDYDKGNMYSAGIGHFIRFKISEESKFKPSNSIFLPKPFLLLSGISGTGKTRFVRQQAKAWGDIDNYCIVPVRPDWHEPSDLLGYISRINGTRYIATDFLRFMIKALYAAVSSIDGNTIVWNDMNHIPPFWLCLDEMNLAPIEQYFADYLSVLETRVWVGEVYSSEPILQGSLLKSLNIAEEDKNPFEILWEELTEGLEEISGFKEYVLEHGIILPPNLIVAGTVNMDETTHGFSRKVIDRALTIDFQEFYPNDFVKFFSQKETPKILSFPRISSISSINEIVLKVDPDGSNTINFLNEINKILKNTPFELAYRALNEILVSLNCFNPLNKKELFAVWDDFLMQKVLPRIEGDTDKLQFDGENTGLINDLKGVVKSLYIEHIGESEEFIRPDLLRELIEKDFEPIYVKCKSLDKLSWMQDRLEKNQYTSFWA